MQLNAAQFFEVNALSERIYDTVIFDLDGTLSDNSEGIIRSTAYAMERLGRPMLPEADCSRLIGPPLMLSFKRFWNMDEPEGLKALAFYHERHQSVGYLENRLYPGIRPLLATLRAQGTHVAVATGKPRDITLRILEHFGVLADIDQVEGSTPSSSKYEKADLIRRITARYPGRAVMIGDTAEDMAGAAGAGTEGIYVRYGFGGAWTSPDQKRMRAADTVADLSRMLLGDIPAPRGLMIALEGLDGCGKTTAARHLDQWLTQQGYEITHTREPGGCPLSESIRALLLAPENRAMTPTVEALLYAASRHQHVTEVILPALQQGRAVLCDRYVASSLAYQGAGRQLGMDTIRQYNAEAIRLCSPDITVYLRLEADQSLARRLAASEPDRIERETRDFFLRVQEGFDRLAAEDPEHFLIIDAGQPLESVAAALDRQLPDALRRGGFWSCA